MSISTSGNFCECRTKEGRFFWHYRTIVFVQDDDKWSLGSGLKFRRKKKTQSVCFSDSAYSSKVAKLDWKFIKKLQIMTYDTWNLQVTGFFYSSVNVYDTTSWLQQNYDRTYRYAIPTINYFLI